jgi:hypothetical protein
VYVLRARFPAPAARFQDRIFVYLFIIRVWSDQPFGEFANTLKPTGTPPLMRALWGHAGHTNFRLWFLERPSEAIGIRKVFGWINELS